MGILEGETLFDLPDVDLDARVGVVGVGAVLSAAPDCVDFSTRLNIAGEVWKVDFLSLDGVNSMPLSMVNRR